jgi:hypothetical protein
MLEKRCTTCGERGDCGGTIAKCATCWEVERRLDEYLRSEAGLEFVLAAVRSRQAPESTSTSTYPRGV